MSCTISAIARSAGSPRPQAREQHLEGAAVALVRELGLEHVEPKLAGLGDVALGGHELEAGLRVDEAPDEPGRGDPVDVDTRARHPGPALELAEASPSCRRRLRESLLVQPALELEEEPFSRLAAVGTEEVDRGDLGEPRLQARELRLRLRAPLRQRIVAERRGDGAELLGEFLVILITRSVEQGPNLLIGEALDEPGLADDRLAAALHDLAQEPLEVLLRLGRRGERVDGVLDRDGADALEPPPDLDPQVGGLGRQLVDQQEPALSGGAGRSGSATWLVCSIFSYTEQHLYHYRSAAWHGRGLSGGRTRRSRR